MATLLIAGFEKPIGILSASRVNTKPKPWAAPIPEFCARPSCAFWPDFAAANSRPAQGFRLRDSLGWRVPGRTVVGVAKQQMNRIFSFASKKRERDRKRKRV